MRKTAIPALTDLPNGQAVVRCQECQELVMAGEACASEEEKKFCPPRFLIDAKITRVMVFENMRPGDSRGQVA